MSQPNQATATPPPTPAPAPLTDAEQYHLDGEFCRHLKNVALQMYQRFPENKEIASLNGQIPMLDMIPNAKRMFRDLWRDFTVNYRESIMKCETEPVVKMFEESDVQQVKSIGMDKVLMDPNVEQQTKDSLWKYMQILTVLAHKGHPTEIKVKTAEGTMEAKPTPIAPPDIESAATRVSAPPAAPGQQPPKPDMEQMIKTALDAAPKVIETLNKVMKDDDGENVVGQMLRQFMNPGALQTGLAPNMAANAMDMASNESVMQAVQSELGQMDPEDVVRQLKQYQRLKELKAKRAKKRG